MEPKSPESRELPPTPQAAGNLTNRIAELQQQAIAAPGDLFVIKLFNSQLVPLTQQLYERITAGLEKSPSLEDASPRLRIAIDLLFKLVRQGERNVRLASELEKAAARELETDASQVEAETSEET